jgi:colanic acid/amylovoran biosynthesis glycosyltransferase
MHVTYFINQYPKVSHTFIRREILALERLGFSIQRVSLRGWDEKLLDADDISEQAKTQYVLQSGIFSLFFNAYKVFIQSPLKFIKTFLLALRMGIRADRPMLFHGIYFLEACQVYSWSKQFSADHIHAHFGTNPSEIVMLTNALSGVPYSFTVHGPEEFDRPVFLKFSEKINAAKFVVAISSFGKSQLQRWIDFSQWDKVKVVHCGLERSFYDVPAVPISNAPRMVCVGRLCEQKGQLLLIEAAKILHDLNVSFELILAGDGEMRNEIETKIAQYGLHNKIKITGWISSYEVRKHILASQLLVLPSFAEGLPVVIMEAMSLRRPVISTYIAGIPELLQHHENGWLCVAGDVDNLAKTMQEALSTPVETLQTMGDAAYERVIQRHNIDIEATKLAKHFQAQMTGVENK